MVQIPAGRYRIGSADDPQAYDNESPVTEIDLPAFSIGKWPVTNAEFACFIEAGGYQDESWWQGELAKRWLQGEEVTGGQIKTWLDIWKQLQDMNDVRKTLETSGNFTPDQVDAYETVAGWTEDELKTNLSQQLTQKSRSQPAFWDDQRYNNPSQPVVGATWFIPRSWR